MHSTLTVTSKGQVTLRREVLEHLGIAPGDKISVDFIGKGRVEIRSAKTSSSITDFINCLHRSGEPALSIDDMNDVISQGWAARK